MEPASTGEAVDQIIDVNEQACTLLEYTKEELLRMRRSALDASGHRPDVPAKLESLAEHGRTRRRGVLVAKTGTEIPVEITSTYFDLDYSRRVITAVRDLRDLSGLYRSAVPPSTNFTVRKLSTAIEQSGRTPEQKAVAQELLLQLAGNPLIENAFKSVLGLLLGNK